ncbi:MAG: hypothetical protein OXR62_13435 [Ahrensia sp.]|nr:hypothetical protein [Ahrensia sp.]
MADFIVWNWPFAVASALTLAVFVLHVVAGGREVRPVLNDQTLGRQARMTLAYAWSLVSAGLLATALVFLAAALRPEWVAIGWAAGLMVAIFAVVSLWQTVANKLPITMVGQWMFFAPIAALALWGATR